MEQIAPGLWHWATIHPRIEKPVHSYYLQPERVAIDVLIPGEGLEWFEAHGPPAHALLTNRHHDRDAWHLHEAYGTRVHCIRAGLHELAGRGPVEVFDWGDELPGGIVAHEVGAICADETALHIPAHDALAVADGVVRWPGVEGLTFVPDHLMDDPPATKAGLIAAYTRLLDELDFDILLMAHGAPVVGGAKQALLEFVQR
jgi:hypothetical protein